MVRVGVIGVGSVVGWEEVVGRCADDFFGWWSGGVVVFGVTGGSASRGGLVLYIRWCLGESEMVGGCIECIGSSYINERCAIVELSQQ